MCALYTRNYGTNVHKFHTNRIDSNPDATLFKQKILGNVLKGHLWYSGSALDYWPTGRATNTAPGA